MARQAPHGDAATPLDEEGALVALRKIVEGVEAETGEGFFRSLVRCVTEALGVTYAFVSELDAERRVFRTIAVWGHGELLDNFELPVAGTPCERVLSGEIAHYANDIQGRFPADVGLVKWQAESYCGVPLVGSDGVVLGHLAIFDVKPMPDARGVAVLRIFAARARAEMERLRVDEQLRRNEARFRDFYEHAPVAYWQADDTGRIERVNRAMEEMLGVPRQEIVGRTLYDFAADTPDGKTKTLALRKHFFAGGEIRADEVECRRADGSPLWIRVSVSGIRDASGRLSGGRVTALDVTAERRAEQALRESEVRYRDLYEQAPVAYWFVTHEGKIDRVNRAMAEMFGYPREFFIGKTLYDLYADTPRGIAAALEVRQRFLSGVGVRAVELEARRADGSPLWLRVSVAPLRDGNGKIAGGRVAAVDVTVQKRVEQVERVTEYLAEEIRAVHNVDEIVGQSPAWMAVLDKVQLVANTDSSVLILGETGTGKELIARAVHAASRRKGRPLIKVNCAALPQALIESELFGHERGAFTGANERRIGRFELAEGGTIFLDEIGEVPLDVQVKLLRVLQEREIERVGGSRTIPIEVRVIAATNRDLEAAVSAGKFRQDLYYRLNVFPVNLPPLRKRPEDIPPLVHYFVTRYAAKTGRRVSRVSPEVMSRLGAYSWPGNIRELENVIERAVILSSGTELVAVPDLVAAPESSLEPTEHPSAAPPSNGMPLEDVERNHVISVLKQTDWRIDGARGAAAVLQLNPSTLRSRMKKLGIRRSRDEA